MEILAPPRGGFLLSSWELGQELRHKCSVSEKNLLDEAAEAITRDDATLGRCKGAHLNVDLRQTKDLLKDLVQVIATAAITTLWFNLRSYLTSLCHESAYTEQDGVGSREAMGD